jgi:hypothetical protein
MNCIRVVQNTNQCWVFLNTVLNITVQPNQVNPFTDWENIRFSRVTLHPLIYWLVIWYYWSCFVFIHVYPCCTWQPNMVFQGVQTRYNTLQTFATRIKIRLLLVPSCRYRKYIQTDIFVTSQQSARKPANIVEKHSQTCSLQCFNIIKIVVLISLRRI